MCGIEPFLMILVVSCFLFVSFFCFSIEQLHFVYKTKDDIPLVVIARDAAWAVNNCIAIEPVIQFGKIEQFLVPLVNAMARLEYSGIQNDEVVHSFIRMGVRAVENALVLSSNQKIECSVLVHNPKLVHLLSMCMRYRRVPNYRDIVYTALNCMRHFSMTLFLRESFIQDISKYLREEQALAAEGAKFFTSWCAAVTCMMKKGMSNKMLMCTVMKITNELHTMMEWPLSNHELRCNACWALIQLGRSINHVNHMDAFWSAVGSNGLLVALSMDNEAAVNRHALLALNNLLPDQVSDTSTYLLAKPHLQTKLMQVVEKLTESDDDGTRQAAGTVLTKLEKLENDENNVLTLEHANNAKPVPLPAQKRRRVELGDLTSTTTTTTTHT